MLIQDLIVYSRSTNTKEEFKKVSLRSILDDVKEDLQHSIEASNAEITLKNDVETTVIPFQFRQLLYNLISNSIRFAKPNESPLITMDAIIDVGESFHVETLDTKTTYCKIIFKDHGIGFDNKYRKKIFELFQRLESKRSATGTGVGLAIVKKIVDNHHGIILAEGQANQGATFEIYLPVD